MVSVLSSATSPVSRSDRPRIDTAPPRTREHLHSGTRRERSVGRVLAQGSSPDRVCAVLRCSIDGLADVRIRHGSLAAATLAQQVAARVRASVSSRNPSSRDVVVQVDGQDLLVALGDLGSPEQVVSLTEALRAAVTGHLEFASGTFDVEVSIGVAIGRRDSRLADLMRMADAALIESKSIGRESLTMPKRAS